MSSLHSWVLLQCTKKHIGVGRLRWNRSVLRWPDLMKLWRHRNYNVKTVQILITCASITSYCVCVIMLVVKLSLYVFTSALTVRLILVYHFVWNQSKQFSPKWHSDNFSPINRVTCVHHKKPCIFEMVLMTGCIQTWVSYERQLKQTVFWKMHIHSQLPSQASLG